MTRDYKLPPDSKVPASPADRDDGQSEGGMISRWAARKQAAAQNEAAAAKAQSEAEAREAERAETEARQTANREKAEAIDINAANYKTDFTPFLKDGVPPALRRQALKALWRTNPILANVDGLNDYDEDFRVVSSAFETIKSTWAVGRGYADKAEDITREMETRDENIRKTMSAEDDTAGEEINEDGDGDATDHDNGDASTAHAQGSSESETTDAPLLQAEPRSQRATLRVRLLKNRT